MQESGTAEAIGAAVRAAWDAANVKLEIDWIDFFLPGVKFWQGVFDDQIGEIERKQQLILGYQSQLGGSAFFPTQLPPPRGPDEYQLTKGQEAFLTKTEEGLRTELQVREAELDAAIEELERIISFGGEGVERALAAQVGLQEQHNEWVAAQVEKERARACLLYTSPSPRD